MATAEAADVAEALGLTWQSFQNAAGGDDLTGWDLAAASAEVRPAQPATPGRTGMSSSRWSSRMALRRAACIAARTRTSRGGGGPWTEKPQRPGRVLFLLTGSAALGVDMPIGGSGCVINYLRELRICMYACDLPSQFRPSLTGLVVRDDGSLQCMLGIRA